MPDPNQSGYPPQSGYPTQPAYGAPSYPSQPGYPGAQSGGYPPQQGYPAQPGYDSYNSNYNSGSSFPPYQPNPPVNPDSYYPPTNQGYNQPPANQYPPTNPGYNPPINQGYNPATSFDNQSHLNNPSLYPQLNPGASNMNTYSPVTIYEGTVRPFQPFNPNDDAAKLYKAMKGFGTDESTLIDILCKRTFAQRKEIAMSYKTGYGKDLLENIKSETKGNLELVFKAILRTPAELEAHDLKKAIDGMGTDEEALIDVMCTKSNSEMIELKNAYRQMYHKDLEREVGGDVSGYFKRLMVSLAAAHRSDNPPDYARAAQQANDLYTAGAKSFGTDEVTFNRIFASESFPHLKLVFEEYYKKTGQDIEKAIKSEMSGNVEKAFCAIVHTARNPPQYYAERLHDAMSGAGTKERTLVRLVALRSERDMVQIKQEFQRRYGKSLESYVKVNNYFKNSFKILNNV